MADEATTAAETETPTGQAAEATQEPKGEAIATGKASKPLTAIERAKAALAKVEAGKAKDKDKTEAKPAESETEPGEKKPEGEDKPTEAAEKPKEDKPAEPKVEEQPKLARGLAILAAREEKVRTAEAALRARIAETETKLAADAADIQTVRAVREAQKTGGLAAALRVLGIDLRTGIEELSRSHAEPSAEDIARRVAAEEWETRQKAQSEQAEKAKREETERAQAADTAEGMSFFQKAAAIAGTMETTDYPRVIAAGVNGLTFWTFAKEMRGKLGRTVAPDEVLGEIEKILKGREDAARAREEAKARKAAPASPAAKTKADAKAEPDDKQPVRRATKTLSPAERAEAAMKRLGIS